MAICLNQDSERIDQDRALTRSALTSLCVYLVILIPIAAESVSSAQAKQPQIERRRTLIDTENRIANAGDTHGTINVVLANRNGLVAVTDSRLSDGYEKRGEGQKLFILDDHSLCTIAGFYTAEGPTMDQKHFLAASAIPKMMEDAKAVYQRHPLFGFEDKIDRVTSVLLFTLNFLQSMKNYDDRPNKPYSALVLTFGTYENGKLRMAQVWLQPVLELNRYRFISGAPSFITVDQKIEHFTAGMPDIANPILNMVSGPSAPDLAVDMYQEQMRANQGRNLSVGQMISLGRRLASLTSSAHPVEVGDDLQIASIQGGKVKAEQVFAKQSLGANFNKKFLSSFERLSIVQEHGGYRWTPAVSGSPEYATLFESSNFENSGIDLDGVLLYGNQFTHCRLSYLNKGSFLLDKSNVFIESRLILPNDADHNSPELKRIAHDFPDLPMMTFAEEIAKYQSSIGP